MKLLAAAQWNNPAGADYCLIDGVPTLKCLEVVFANLLGALGGIVFLIMFCLFLYGSFMWLTAGDDAGKLKKAQGIFYSAVLGLLIIGGGYLILIALEQIFGISLTTFEIPIN